MHATIDSNTQPLAENAIITHECPDPGANSDLKHRVNHQITSQAHMRSWLSDVPHNGMDVN